MIEAAAKAKSDIIIQLLQQRQFHAGQGHPDSFKAKVVGAVAAAQQAHLLAEHYGICVAMHTDHCATKILPWIDGLLTLGEKHFAERQPLYSSHMLDLSEEPLEENLSTCERTSSA